jgi:PHD/YefM family antitoxin component YafN of YafNO toxin-antitoxin module
VIIKASTSLRNDYVAISDLAREIQEPIYITRNGEGDLVVMNIDAFERRDELIRLRARLENAEYSRLAGDTTFSLKDSKARLDKIYE